MYKPGKENVVADALSRQVINTNTMHSQEESSVPRIKSVNKAINAYGIQIFLSEGNKTSIVTRNIFTNRVRHEIIFKNTEDLIAKIKEIAIPTRTNSIYTTPELIHKYGDKIKETFLNYEFIHTTKKLIDITDRAHQLKIVEQIHDRAHRSYRNNELEIMEKYYWPEISHDTKRYNNQCISCIHGKYERHPNKEPMKEGQIPIQVGTHIHMDIYFITNDIYLTAKDKYSKYMTITHITDRREIYRKIEEVLVNNYPHCKRLMTDNENCLNTPQVKAICRNLKIEKICTPVHHSKSNGQIERAHSSLTELSKILKFKNKSEIKDEIYIALRELNNSIHSTIGKKPAIVHFNKETYDNNQEIIDNLNKASKKIIE